MPEEYLTAMSRYVVVILGMDNGETVLLAIGLVRLDIVRYTVFAGPPTVNVGFEIAEKRWESFQRRY